MQRILVVEDDLDIQELLKNFLQEVGYEIALSSDGVEALSTFSSAQFDLVLLDVMLPKIDGFAVCELIRKQSQVPIIMLTALSGEEEQIRGLDLQVDDYITKPFSMILLGRRITALLRRCGKGAVSDIMTFGDVTVNFSGYTAKDKNGRIDITPKEIDLLRLLVEHKGLVLTRSQILDELWGDSYPIIDRTVDTYIKNLRKKLRLDCIVTVKGIGYKYEVEQ